MLEWRTIDRGFDIVTPVKQPERPGYIAIDAVCFISLCMFTFGNIILDAKVLLLAMRIQERVQRNFPTVVDRGSSDLAYPAYSESLATAINELFDTVWQALFYEEI